MIKKFIIFTLLIWGAFTAGAVNTKFVMSAPNAVEMGSQFRLSFTLNQKGTNLKLPPGLTENFDVLMGPSTSYSQSISTINGRVTQNVEYSYTYILRAKKTGTFELRPASINVNGKIFVSNTLKIQVVKANQKAAVQQSGKPQGRSSGNNAPVSIDNKNIFTRVVLSKRNVYKGEQIIATIKLYVDPTIPVSGFDDVNLPSYEGFYTQDIKTQQQIKFVREVYNDKIYQVGILKKTVLFPQQNGKITIKPFDMSVLVQQRVKQRSFFDDFFNSYRTIKVKVTSKPVTVNVKDLPPAPANFLSGVGNFNISSDLSAVSATTNDAITLTVKISGTGNIRLIKTPELKLPSDFEVYDPRATENVNTTDKGVSGTKTIEYLFQPRFEGDYTIPAIKFAYFNPATGKYVTIATKEFKLHVTKGNEEQSATVVSSLRKEDVRLIGKDIRFIRQGNPQLKNRGETFFGSTAFYLIYLISTILFLIIIIVYRKKIKENANVALVRNKKANSIARKRLKAAAAYMKQNNDEAFHDEILKAFTGYLSDKLGIPVAELNRETAISTLQERNVEQNIIDDYIDVIDQCEFARFAPAGGSEARKELYKKAEATMSKFEKQIKK